MKISAKRLLVAAFAVGGLCTTSTAVNASSLVTKQPGSKTYGIYRNISKKGVSHKVASTSDFKYGHYQSTGSRSTKKGRYWYVYVDGHKVGWVNEHFFARNKIAVANSVSLVKNSYYSFPTRDAISYATDSHGTVINPSKVTVSHAYVNSNKAGTTHVTYKAGKASASVDVTVRDDASEGVSSADCTPKSGPKAVKVWKSHRNNFNYATKANTYKNNCVTIKTKFFEPSTLSLRGNSLTQVGPIPEGLVVSNGWATSSMLANSNEQMGHLVSYKMNKMSKFNTQKLSSLSLGSFKKLARNIKVSPYIKLGHGQALGASSEYLYVVANNNCTSNSSASEELIQIRKSDMQINKIWTFKIWNGSSAYPRYIHNAVIVDDNTMYALFHNGGKNSYEYWKLTRSGDTWTPQEVGATQSNFVSNSPVQGITYNPVKNNFAIAFNDNIFWVKEDGTYQGRTHFNTHREIEGLSISNNCLFVQMAQRSEVLSGNTK